jgi:hypothetical protein
MFGYVVFEGPRTLLDWGVRTYVSGERLILEARVSNLRSMFAPSVILVRKPAEAYQLRQPMIRPALHSLTIFAKRLLITMRIIDHSTLRRYFSMDLEVKKYDIARMVADRFPELSWRLPSERKIWESEPTRQSIFDAASLGVFYFALEFEERPIVTQASG